MLTSIVITFREFLEMLIIIVPLMVYVGKIDRKDLQKHILAGSGTGFLLSAFSSVFLIKSLNSLQGIAREMFLGGTMIFLAGLILHNVVWISNQNKSLSLEVHSKLDVQLKGISLFMLAAITIFRENLEVIMFLLPSLTDKPVNTIIGVVVGVLGALLIMIILYKTTVKLNLYIIFSALTVFLIIIGGHMFGEGLAEFIPGNESIEMAGQLIYSIPLLFLFLKRELKKYMRKK